MCCKNKPILYLHQGYFENYFIELLQYDLLLLVFNVNKQFRTHPLANGQNFLTAI